MFKLGTKSLAELNGVHPSLVAVVHRAIQLTEADFSVHDGVRLKTEQEKNVASGASRTMDSLHLPQADGFSHAVDLVPYIAGTLKWDMDACYKIAEAMRKAAEELKVQIRWGGSWSTLNGTTISAKRMVEQYVAARRKAGKKAFIDAVHYEWLNS